jgi:hypothetical protein
MDALLEDMKKTTPEVMTAMTAPLELFLMIEVAKRPGVSRERLWDWITAFLQHQRAASMLSGAGMVETAVSEKSGALDVLAGGDKSKRYELALALFGVKSGEMMEKHAERLKTVRDGMVQDYAPDIREGADRMEQERKERPAKQEYPI